MSEHSQNERAERQPDAARGREQSTDRTNVGTVDRVAGGALGAGLLLRGMGDRSPRGVAMSLAGGYMLYRAFSGHCYVYQGVGVNTAASTARTEPGASMDATEIRRSVTVNAEPEELSEYWRDPEHLDDVVGNFAEVSRGAAGRLRWEVEAPRDRTLTWESRIVEDRPGELLTWESVAGADLPNEGTVQFRPAPGDQGTEVSLRVRFDAPGGTVGELAMKYMDVVPEAVVGKALRRFKSLVETGEAPTLERNPSARGAGDAI